jgi:hypothetical protein
MRHGLACPCPTAGGLALLVVGPAWRALIALAPSGAAADRLLARLVASDPHPGLRHDAVGLIGHAWSFAALGAGPVDRSAAGELYVFGPSAAPTAALRVEDPAAGPGGARREHWLAVPAHLATAREAVARTSGKAAGDYAPVAET